MPSLKNDDGTRDVYCDDCGRLKDVGVSDGFVIDMRCDSCRAEKIAAQRIGRTLEDIVREHVTSRDIPALLYRCKNTGEVGTMREFAERIAKASRSPLEVDTAVKKISYAARSGKSYRGLWFERCPDEMQPKSRLLHRSKRADRNYARI